MTNEQFAKLKEELASEIRQEIQADLKPNGFFVLIGKLRDYCVLPLLLLWGVWVTQVLMTHGAQHEQTFSKSDAYQMQRALDLRFNALPPQDWRDIIKALQTDVRSITAIVQQNQVELAKLTVLLNSHMDKQKP